MTKKETLTSPEKVIFKAELKFNLETMKLSEEEAEIKALEKINRIRDLKKTLPRR
jgi:hypothetical protein